MRIYHSTINEWQIFQVYMRPSAHGAGGGWATSNTTFQLKYVNVVLLIGSSSAAAAMDEREEEMTCLGSMFTEDELQVGAATWLYKSRCQIHDIWTQKRLWDMRFSVAITYYLYFWFFSRMFFGNENDIL